MPVKFEWRLEQGVLRGYTITQDRLACGHCGNSKEGPGLCSSCGKFPTEYKPNIEIKGRETRIFEIFKRQRGRRLLPYRLVRISSHGVEDFKSQRLAKEWAEKLLSKDVVIERN